MGKQIEAEINRIDRKIDLTRAELRDRAAIFDEFCTGCWQFAWDKCPDLKARDNALFLQRGLAQQVRDAEDEKAYRRAQRSERAAARRQYAA